MVLGGRALKYHGCSSSGGNKSAYSRMSSSNVWWRAAIEQVRETLGAQVQEMGADQTGQNVRDALRDAFRLGFETESQALRYVNVMVAMGPALAYEARHAAARRPAGKHAPASGEQTRSDGCIRLRLPKRRSLRKFCLSKRRFPRNGSAAPTPPSDRRPWMRPNVC
jgi:hypothetical protein